MLSSTNNPDHELTGEQSHTHHDYWIAQLSDLEPLELPSDHARPAMASHQGNLVAFAIGSSLTAPFEALCQSEEATLEMGLVALIGLLLHRHSRQDDFAIGIPLQGCIHPIRVQIQSRLTLRHLLSQIKATFNDK